VSESFDPWEAASNSRKLGDRKKTLRLAGNGQGKAHVLIKCHDWRGRAVYVFHLIRNASKRIDKPTAEEWDRYSQLGVAVPYPSTDHTSTDIEHWVAFGREQAEKLGFRVSE
jgi:hypothetical protein